MFLLTSYRLICLRIPNAAEFRLLPCKFGDLFAGFPLALKTSDPHEEHALPPFPPPHFLAFCRAQQAACS
jgi:hypothetical protein